MRKRILCLLISCLLLCSMALPLSASFSGVIRAEGKITIQMTWKDKKLHGGELTLYRVYDVIQKTGSYEIVPVEELKNSKLPSGNLESLEAAEKLAALAKSKRLPKITQPIKKGKAVFTGLMDGVYVVTQSDSQAVPGYEPIQPFLISLPVYENGKEDRDLLAEPKISLKPDKPGKPDKPDKPDNPDKPIKPSDKEDKPKLPQTGQLQWPVPLLTVSGLTLFAFGWGLRFGKQREDDEN